MRVRYSSEVLQLTISPSGASVGAGQIFAVAIGRNLWSPRSSLPAKSQCISIRACVKAHLQGPQCGLIVSLATNHTGTLIRHLKTKLLDEPPRRASFA